MACMMKVFVIVVRHGNSHETEGDFEDIALCSKVHEAMYDAARSPAAILEERLLCLHGSVAESRHVEDVSCSGELMMSAEEMSKVVVCSSTNTYIWGCIYQ